MHTINLTELRNNIYKIVDSIIETGESYTIMRGAHRLRIDLWDAPSAQKRGSKLARLKKPAAPAIACSDEELIYGTLGAWNEADNL